MPRRSSRSRPASLTSLSEPTGSASLAIAMAALRLTVPVVVVADAAQSLARRLVAERSRDAGGVERARSEAERLGRLVVAREVGVEHRRVVGRDRARNAGCHEARQRMVRERRDRARPEVRERADGEDGAARRELADDAGSPLSTGA